MLNYTLGIYIINNVCIHFFTFSLFIEPDLH